MTISPGSEPFWRLETLREIELTRVLLQRRFPSIYADLTFFVESADPLGLVRPGNPHEYDDVIREFLVLAWPTLQKPDELTAPVLRPLLGSSFARCFSEPPSEDSLNDLATLLAGRWNSAKDQADAEEPSP